MAKIISVLRLLLVVALSLMVFAANAAEKCWQTIDAIWAEGDKILAALKADPFSEGFGATINNLRKNREGLDQWLSRANQEVKACEELHRRHDALIHEHNSRCTNQTPEAWNARGCQQSYERTEASANHVDAYKNAMEQRLNPEGAILIEAQKKAVAEAKRLLDQTYLTDSFWLYAQKKSEAARAGKITSCEAMAQMYGALVKRADANLEFMRYPAGQVLAGGVSYRGFSLVPKGERGQAVFTSSGFRSQYVDNPQGDQVRHFTGYFIMGMSFPNETVTEIIADLREKNEPGDYQLGVVAANLAARLRQNPNLVPGLGGAIRSTVCR